MKDTGVVLSQGLQKDASNTEWRRVLANGKPGKVHNGIDRLDVVVTTATSNGPFEGINVWSKSGFGGIVMRDLAREKDDGRSALAIVALDIDVTRFQVVS